MERDHNYFFEIPLHEIEITSSRAGGPGGQHVNKTNTKVTVRWHVTSSSALTDEQKERVFQKLHKRISKEGNLIVYNSSSRSQEHNKKMALADLHALVARALYIPKKRKKAAIPRGVKEARLREKLHRSELKKRRSGKHDE